MKIILSLILMTLSFEAFSITTKNCPEKLELGLKGFRQGVVPAPDEQNANLPYAYINLETIGSLDDVLELRSTANSTCYYSGDSFTAKISGSLKEGAKKPAVLAVYFNDAIKNLNLDYVVYSSIEKLTKDKALVLKKGAGNLYYQGEQCSWGDCVVQNFKVGFANIRVSYSENVSCISFEGAEKALEVYLMTERAGGVEPPYGYDDDYDQDIYEYDFTRSEEIFRYLETLNFYHDGYYGGSTYSYECAASAECWGGYVVSCDGTVDTWHDGEE